jgi:phytoene dehydrogenase-like protein
MGEAVYFERLNTMSGYEASKLVWESPQMRAAGLAGGHFGAVPGSDPGTGAQAFSLMGQLAGRPMPKGGSGMLTVALGRAIEANNGIVLTNKGVTRLLIESGKCAGVECADGSTYRARRAVVSTIHVKHLINMAPRELFGDEFVERTNLWQAEHSMFAFHFALSEHPKYAMAGGGTTTSPEAAVLQHSESIFTLNSDRARGELTLDDVPLQIVTPSSVDPSRAPAGMATLKIEGTLPYELKGGVQQWDSVKDKAADTLLTYYMKLTTNITRDKILAHSFFSPPDIERMNPAMWRGSVHHGDRRFNDTMPYRSKIEGLYLTGGCTGSGGSVSGNPGRGAAAEILKDAGTSIEQVVNKGRTA